MKRIPMQVAAIALLFLAGEAANSQDQPASEKKIPFHCPVVGMPEAKACCCPGGYCPRGAKASITADYKGAKLQFCCPQCIKAFKDAPAKFAVAANHQLVATGQAKQVQCPLTGRAIDPKASVEVAGVQVFFASAEGQKKIAEATPFVLANLVFGEQGFARGFVMTPKQQ